MKGVKTAMNKHINLQLSEIVSNYFLCKNQFTILSFSSGKINYSNPYYIYYRDVELALNRLQDEERIIIKNDYFNNVTGHWWRRFFTIDEYNAHKRRAIRNFVRNFYEIHS